MGLLFCIVKVFEERIETVVSADGREWIDKVSIFFSVKLK